VAVTNIAALISLPLNLRVRSFHRVECSEISVEDVVMKSSRVDAQWVPLQTPRLRIVIVKTVKHRLMESSCINLCKNKCVSIFAA